jgi:hypothetical protein
MGLADVVRGFGLWVPHAICMSPYNIIEWEVSPISYEESEGERRVLPEPVLAQWLIRASEIPFINEPDTIHASMGKID